MVYCYFQHNDFFHLYTLSEGIIISVRSLQRSEGGVSHKVYIFLIGVTRRVYLAMSACASVRFYAN